MDYVWRRLALDYLPFESRSAMGIYSAQERQRHLETGSYEPVVETGSAAELIDGPAIEITDAELVETKDSHGNEAREVPAKRVQEAHTSAELMEKITGTAVDSPLCFTCGTKMRPAGSCYVCEGCGSTSGCS
jgi:ribonucleoside-diphosphate reductase alpha chain